MTLVGGIRARMIRESIYHLLVDSLTSLGWLTHSPAHQDVTVLPEPVPFDQQVAFNSIGIADANSEDTPAEIGSELTEDTSVYYVDFFAENEPIGQHMINDIRDILRGKMSAIGRTASVLRIYDYRNSPATQIGYAEIEQVLVDRAHGFPHPWMEHMRTVRFHLVDAYESDLG